MKANTILISFLERIYKAKRKEDFSNLLEVQIKLNELDKENRILKTMLKEKTELNINLESNVSKSERERLSLQNSVDLLERDKKSLKEEIEELTKNITI